MSATIGFRINDIILEGDGVNKTLGILNSPALVSQAIEGSQTIANGEVVINNVVKKCSRMYAPCRRNAVRL